MYTGITVGAITTIGNKHVSRGTPCEDASFAVTRNGVSVVCIADGAGGKQYTDARFGSDCAVHVISDTLCDHFDALYSGKTWWWWSLHLCCRNIRWYRH